MKSDILFINEKGEISSKELISPNCSGQFEALEAHEWANIQLNYIIKAEKRRGKKVKVIDYWLDSIIDLINPKAK